MTTITLIVLTVTFIFIATHFNEQKAVKVRTKEYLRKMRKENRNR